jgi:hypothetical protein
MDLDPDPDPDPDPDMCLDLLLLLLLLALLLSVLLPLPPCLTIVSLFWLLRVFRCVCGVVSERARNEMQSSY